MKPRTIIIASVFVAALVMAGTGIGAALFIFIASDARAENKTTGNVAGSMANMTASGGTSYGTGSGCQQGKYCTSGTQGGGGTYTSSFNVPLTEKEVNKGFTLNSGITINSHVSNSYLDSCTNVMQSGDCRDVYKLTITLSDDGTVVETFIHEEELTWSGIKDFTYTDTVAENSYGVLSGVFSLYGIDAGYPYGFYGPQFSDPSLTIDYQTVLVQQQDTDIINQNETIVQEQVIEIAEVALPTTTTTTSTAPPTTPSISNMPANTSTGGNASETAPTADIEAPSAPETPTAPTVEANTAPSDAESTTEAQAEAEIEAEAGNNESTGDTTTEASSTSENSSEANEESAATSASESSGGTSGAAKPSSGPKAASKASKSTKTKVRMSPARAAQVVVSRIAPSQRYGTNAQTVTMVAMGMIAQTSGLLKQKGLPDGVKFWDARGVPDGPSLVDPSQSYVFFGTSNGAHDALVESQWRK